MSGRILLTDVTHYRPETPVQGHSRHNILNGAACIARNAHFGRLIPAFLLSTAQNLTSFIKTQVP